jgi:bromodomain and WD repeat domain-containing protein 1/3
MCKNFKLSFFLKNFVDSIQYANHSTRFLSGSKDGTARIWKYERREWKAMLIDASKSFQKNNDLNDISLDLFKKHSVTMVTWNSDDTLVVTAQNNYLLKVWNSNDARLVHELKGHTDEVYVLEAHPRDARLLLSAGHDGLIIFWNLLTGKMIKKIYNKVSIQD